MKVSLPRYVLGKDGKPTLGRWVSDDGFACVTLERSANGEFPCIPAGTYRVELGHHHPGDPKGYPCPVITQVPGRSFIHVHIANKASELRGCVALGEKEATDAIEQSRKAFERWMTHWAGKGFQPFELTITDP